KQPVKYRWFLTTIRELVLLGYCPRQRAKKLGLLQLAFTHRRPAGHFCPGGQYGPFVLWCFKGNVGCAPLFRTRIRYSHMISAVAINTTTTISITRVPTPRSSIHCRIRPRFFARKLSAFPRTPSPFGLFPTGLMVAGYGATKAP